MNSNHMSEIETKLVDALVLLETKLTELQELGQDLKRHGDATARLAEQQRLEIKEMKTLIARQKRERGEDAT